MARVIFVLLLVAAAVVMVALARDRRGRLEARVARLRSSFLHGAPLGRATELAEMREVVLGGLVRFRVPRRWREESDGPGGALFHTGGPTLPTLRVAVRALDAPSSLDDLRRRLPPGSEATLEDLPAGRVLGRRLQPDGPGGAEQVVYEWHLAATAGAPRAGVVQFRLAVPLAAAADLIVQSEVGLVEREVRAAAFVAAG